MDEAHQLEWLRNAEFCSEVLRLRVDGNSWKEVRRKVKAKFGITAKVSDDTMRRAISKGPINFFSKNTAVSSQ